MVTRQKAKGERVFTIRGLTDDGREAAVTWWEPEARRRLERSIERNRGLDGDAEIVRLAILDEALGRGFAATVTGPFLLADLDDAHASLVQLGSYFRPGLRVDGDPPSVSYPAPDGAIP